MHDLIFIRIEILLLLLNLLLILYFVMLRKRIVAIVLISIAIVQHLLINWNTILYIFLELINLF